MSPMHTKYLTVSFVILLFCNTIDVDGKRIFSGGGSKKSTHYSSRPSYSHSSTSSHGSSHSSGSGSSIGTRYSNSDLTKLSYGGGTHSQPSRPTSFGTSGTHHQTSGGLSNTNHGSSSNIGWNIPNNKPAGPPPAYSATNPLGGARTNLHESPPAYKPSAPATNFGTSSAHRPSAPAYSSLNHGSNSNAYKPSAPSGVGAVHTPISATNAHNVHSSYPRQQMPAGATYYPAGSHLPAGATYHSPGHLPPGATYHSSLPAGATYHNSVPPGATYHNSVPPGATFHNSVPPGATYHNSVPPGATFHSPNYMPAGATYHSPGHLPVGASYYPAAAAVPAGATFLPVGAAIPMGATYYPQPPRTSSGPGFGTGLIAGGIGGALLGHALTPSGPRIVERPIMTGGGGSGYSNSGGEDRVIIINNGPPGSVTTTDVGHGTTVINANTGVPASAPAAAPLAPISPVASAPPVAPVAPVAPVPPVGPVAPFAPVASAPQAPADSTTLIDLRSGFDAPVQNPNTQVATAPAAQQNPADPAAAQNGPPAAGGIICVPVRVNEPDPADKTKTIEVEKIACYPAPPPETSTISSTSGTTISPTTAAGDSTITSTIGATTTSAHVPIASEAPIIPASQSAQLSAFQPTQPVIVPEGSVALSPFYPNTTPDIMKLPGGPLITKRSTSTSNAANVHVNSVFITTILLFLVRSIF